MVKHARVDAHNDSVKTEAARARNIKANRRIMRYWGLSQGDLSYMEADWIHGPTVEELLKIDFHQQNMPPSLVWHFLSVGISVCR